MGHWHIMGADPGSLGSLRNISKTCLNVILIIGTIADESLETCIGKPLHISSGNLTGNGDSFIEFHYTHFVFSNLEYPRVRLFKQPSEKNIPVFVNQTLLYICYQSNLASMNIQDMENNSEQAALLMGMLSNPKRLMILCQLLDGEKSVMALVEAIGISQSALSQHLAKLRAAGLVATRRDAQTIYYRSAGREAVAVLELLNSLYCAADEDQCAVEG